MIGVLVMAYGGPQSVDELPGYLADIRSGRVTTPSVLEEISDHYRKIGGRSPINGITSAQVEQIQASLDATRFRCYMGMRHWSPWIEEVVGQMIDDGVDKAVGLVLAPHFSSMSVARYQAKIRDGLQMYRGDIDFRYIDDFHDLPALVEALASRVRGGIERFDAAERDSVHVVLTAHSLPLVTARRGDKYANRLLHTARLVAARAGLPPERWTWSYQSAGASAMPWMGPDLPDHIAELAGRGVRNIVCLPVGFLSDHVEVLFDIDVEGQEAARAHGVRLERPEGINDDPHFARALASLVAERVGDWLS